MEPEFFFPPRPSEYPAWLENFYTVLDQNKVLLGIATDDLTYLNKARLSLNYYGKCIHNYSEFASKVVHTRNIFIYGDPDNAELGPMGFPVPPTAPTVPTDDVAPNIHVWITTYVGRLRKNPNMNTVLSKALGIDSRPTSSYNGEPPYLKGQIVNGQAQLNCPLKNAKGYEVWRKDAPGEPFRKINTSTARYYVDTAELPDGINAAQWTYIVRLVGIDNEPMGLPSNEVTLTVYRAMVSG